MADDHSVPHWQVPDVYERCKELAAQVPLNLDDPLTLQMRHLAPSSEGARRVVAEMIPLVNSHDSNPRLWATDEVLADVEDEHKTDRAILNSVRKSMYKPQRRIAEWSKYWDMVKMVHIGYPHTEGRSVSQSMQGFLDKMRLYVKDFPVEQFVTEVNGIRTLHDYFEVLRGIPLKFKIIYGL